MGTGLVRRSVDFGIGVAHVKRVDPALAGVAAQVGPFNPRPPMGDHFNALVRAIAYQQLAGAAAAAILGRFLKLYDRGLPTPKQVLATPEEAMRASGLSAAKTASIRDLATKFTDGTLSTHDVEQLDDEEIIRRLVTVRGIGRWSAEMFLIFQLRRPDVWPVDDLGVRRGYAVAHGLAEWPAPKALDALGDVYRPWRTIAAWYCWRTIDIKLPS